MLNAPNNSIPSSSTSCNTSCSTSASDRSATTRDEPPLYRPLFQKKPDTTSYKKLAEPESSVQIVASGVPGKPLLIVRPEALEQAIARGFDDMSHLFRRDHLRGWSRILKDPSATDNDRYVAHELLRNAVIASQRVFPSCQDTGTAIVIAWKGEQVWLQDSPSRPGYSQTKDPHKEAITRGIYQTYQQRNLRYSQMAPQSMYQETNTRTNLPAQISLYSVPGQEYQFMCIAKGGGSANKTFLYQKTRALLREESMLAFLREALISLGTAACPPYHLAVVVGGLSAEHNLQTLKLASCRYYEDLPHSGDDYGRAFRDPTLETQIMTLAQSSGIGAQFGGQHFAQSVRALRLPRHGASLVVSIGVSCSADRQILGKINRRGVFLEELEEDPGQFLPSGESTARAGYRSRAGYRYGENLDAHQSQSKHHGHGHAVKIHLDDQPMAETLKTLDQHPVGTRLSLHGTLIVARDMAHSRMRDHLETTGKLPDYLCQFPVYYAGPAKTPEGYASGSFGPTTSQRMDSYVELFQRAGGSMIMLGKGNRSREVIKACEKYGGFYLGSIGGPAARLGRDCITSVAVIDHAELGMEAVWKITVRDFPAFIITDNKGFDFFVNPPIRKPPIRTSQP